jgi:hypothetical protein
MKSEYKILDQLTPENANPYSIPVGYFDGLANVLLARLKSKEVTYAVPQNYFESLSFQVLQKIQQQKNNTEIVEELEIVAPLLNTIHKANIYKIPTNYFENITTEGAIKSTKVVAIYSPLNWLKYAVAAVIIGIVSIGFFLINTKKDNNKILASYHQALKINIEKSVSSISDTDLNNAVEANKLNFYVADDINVVLPWNNLDNLKDEIKFISDEEIQFYIEENKIVVEESTISNS